MKAGFAEVDITPDPGVKKIGWMEDLTGGIILDSLSGLAAVFEAGDERIGFIQLDILSIRWTQVNNIRKKIEALSGFPGRNILISATHNHAGPAAANVYPVNRDEKYLRYLEKNQLIVSCPHSQTCRRPNSGLAARGISKSPITGAAECATVR